jgi:hypothetical protein
MKLDSWDVQTSFMHPNVQGKEPDLELTKGLLGYALQ